MRPLLPLLLTAALLPACDNGPAAECAEAAMINGYRDEDGDGHGDAATKTLVCEVGVAGWVATGLDCDDTRSAVNPDQIEECDGLDNDCDNQVDEGLRGITYYADEDGDGYGHPDITTEACTPPPGFVENSSDCDDGDPLSYPGSAEFCDGEDNDCDGLIDDGDPSIDPTSQSDWYLDSDGDGYGNRDLTQKRCTPPGPQWVDNDLDCNDSNVGISPDAQEYCDGFDNDCDGLIDDSDPTLDPIGINTWYYDFDGDGYGDPGVPIQACNQPWFYVGDQTDCDDSNEFITDSSSTYWLTDGDGDGFGNPSASPIGPQCAPPGAGYAPQAAGGDCNDGVAAINPDATEICDGLDNDCDLLLDDADDSVDLNTADVWYVDADGDTYGDPDTEFEACTAPPGAVADDTDCDDTVAAVNPGAPEICNGNLDDDCNGLADEADPGLDPASAPNWFVDFDGDGWGDPSSGVTVACNQPVGQVDNNLDCDDNDDTILGDVDWIDDGDGDGVGAGAVLASGCVPPGPNAVPDLGPQDCDDNDQLTYPGAVEICGDGIDQDCDGPDQVCPYDTCVQANNGVPITTDTRYMHDLSSYVDDIALLDNNLCTTAPTDGADAILPVSIAPGTNFAAWMVGTGDSSLYLVNTCSNPNPDTDCRIGSDGVAAGGESEHVWYTNRTATTQTLFLVADCNGPCTDFELELRFNQFDLGDTCTDLAGLPGLTSGGHAYAGTLAGYADNSDLGPIGCTGFDSAGGDALVPVDLGAGETLTVHDYFHELDDASVYIVSTCADPFGTCLVGSDSTGAGASESTAYTNTGGGTQRVYLVLDCSQSLCRDFEARFGIE